MSLVRPKIATAVWHLLPAPVRRKLRGETGNRLMRFVPVSLAAVAASQITLAVLVGVAGRSAGTAAVIASMVGAAVSYMLSRWAWERKGKPNLLKETLPFWLVSVGAWIVLGVASHYASVWAVSMNLGHWQRVAVVNGVYFVANCVTFVTRFAIFHYVLFADRGSKQAPPPLAGGPGLAAAPDLADSGGPVGPVNGQGIGPVGRQTDPAHMMGTTPADAQGPAGVGSGPPSSHPLIRYTR
jgi:putative flippase GtrA